MLKYYALLVLVAGIALLYAFHKDPCNRQVRADLLDRHPGYKVLDSTASEGSPESVRCNISYQEPGSEQIHDAIWLYRYSDDVWKFARILETPDSDAPSS